MIAVTINYRLGPFGFLCVSAGMRESGHTGNYGIYDQLSALQWVRDNIASFGGDPDNVTLMGQSAGCMSVQMLCISPKAKGLFRRAVLCSGAGRSEFFDGKNPMEDNLSFGDAVMEALGCETMEDVRRVSAWRIQKTFGELLMKAGRGLAVTSPVIDDDLIPCPVSTAIETKQLHNIPYILCSTGQDLWQPELYHAVLKWEDEAEAQGIGPCWAAHFSRHLPGDERGAFHSADLWYWCGTLQNSWRPNTAWDWELSRRMIGHLIRFAKTGDPNGDGLPRWHTHGEAPEWIMVFGDEEAAEQNAGDVMK